MSGGWWWRRVENGRGKRREWGVNIAVVIGGIMVVVVVGDYDGSDSGSSVCCSDCWRWW